MQCIEILAHSERKKREIIFQLISENVTAKCKKWSPLFVLCQFYLVLMKLLLRTIFLMDIVKYLERNEEYYFEKNVLKH